MDKVEKYQEAIIDFLEEKARLRPVNLKNVENQIIIDKENRHYQLLSIGWDDNKFNFHAVFHFDIRDGKVWIQRNDTEVMVADELIERGVAREDIVLGFQPPYARPYTGFATA
ncbi:MAG: XisI protein [Phaeodactylibacter sp.]|nr:XisI protein [Phaeodactylibacter sp.]